MIGKMTDDVADEIHDRVHDALHPRQEALNCRAVFGVSTDDVLSALGVKLITDINEVNPEKAKEIGAQPVKPALTANGEKRKNAVEAVRNGETYSAVAKRIGVSLSSVSNWCKAAGVKSTAMGGPAPRKLVPAQPTPVHETADAAQYKYMLSRIPVDDAKITAEQARVIVGFIDKNLFASIRQDRDFKDIDWLATMLSGRAALLEIAGGAGNENG